MTYVGFSLFSSLGYCDIKGKTYPMYPNHKGLTRIQAILMAPPLMALFGFAVYLLRSYLKAGVWLIHDKALAIEMGFGPYEDSVLMWVFLSVVCFVPWCCLQFYLVASNRQHVRLFWMGLMAYLAMGYTLLVDAFGLVPYYWD